MATVTICSNSGAQKIKNSNIQNSNIEIYNLTSVNTTLSLNLLGLKSENIIVILAPPSCVAVGKLLNLSETQMSPLYKGNGEK